MQVRRANDADIPAIVSMGARFYETTYYTQFADYDDDSAERLIRMMIDPETGVLLVAEHDGELVGMVGLLVTGFLFNTARRYAAEIMWWTADESRKTGAGVALLRAIVPACKEAGCEAIQMVRLKSSPPQTERLYERLGFHLGEHSHMKVL